MQAENLLQNFGIGVDQQPVSATAGQSYKTFWRKITHAFCKVYLHFIGVNKICLH